MITYQCEICHEINSVRRFHCKSCGTIPTRYSGTGKPIREDNDLGVMQVIAAINADRIERHRTVKRSLRTVPADYYASVD